MRNCVLLAAASVAGVAFGSVDVSFSAHADAETLAAIVGVLGAITTLAKRLLQHKRG